jgi:hypothetical protein
MTGKCAMDVSTFPYDTQTCSLQFTCFGLTVNEVNLTVSPVAAVNTMYYTPDSDWTVESFWAELSWRVQSSPRILLEVERLKDSEHRIVSLAILPLQCNIMTPF